MKILICDYQEPLNRDLSIETSLLRAGLGPDTEVAIYEHHGDRGKLVRALQGVDAVLTAYLEFPADIIEAADRLKVISIEATGYNYVDAAAAERRGVGVAVIGEYCTQEVADHTMALALAVARNLKIYGADIERNHRYDFNAASGMIRLEGSTLGILGLGKIGRAVARRAQGFGFRVVAHDPFCPKELAEQCGAALVGLDTLLETAHIITLNMLLTPQSRGILNREAFSKMKNKPVIVNVSRGELIVEEDLIWALDNGLIYGAGLDVLCEETHEAIASHPLVGRGNVILTPHAAFYSDFSFLECARISCANIVHYLTGRIDRVFRMVNNAQPAG